MFEAPIHLPQPRVWTVGALCRAIADALEARFNPVSVSGEISGFSRAASGHCYFVLKDSAGQLRCAMFRRAAGLLDFAPRDGEQVQVRGRLGVYEPRGELQLIVESMSRSGQGSLFEQFLQRKAKLEALGLFAAERKRPLPTMPRSIGLVTSLGAAALHDVLTALQRRVPHIPVIIAPASVQGEQAPRELVQALQALYGLVQNQTLQPGSSVPLDVILLVRGGGALEDLWAFNDEQLAHTIAASPVPVIAGVGHETDFTIADFVADLRAPTPTAAAELVSASTGSCQRTLEEVQAVLRRTLSHYLDRQAQQVDHLATRLGRPLAAITRQRAQLHALQQAMRHALHSNVQQHRADLHTQQQSLPRAVQSHLQHLRQSCSHAELRLQAQNPAQVLQRGYAWLSRTDGKPVTRVAQLSPGQVLHATLADGSLEVLVQHSLHN
ncbi:MAG: exodeoxyribonuclease VII large subunit [Rhodoferax sp.]|nr:exodeoxyribonuclease VII large subunit [Rhodoferax sp.]